MSEVKSQKKEYGEKFPIPLMHHVSRKKIGSVMHGKYIINVFASILYV